MILSSENKVGNLEYIWELYQFKMRQQYILLGLQYHQPWAVGQVYSARYEFHPIAQALSLVGWLLVALRQKCHYCTLKNICHGGYCCYSKTSQLDGAFNCFPPLAFCIVPSDPGQFQQFSSKFLVQSMWSPQQQNITFKFWGPNIGCEWFKNNRIEFPYVDITEEGTCCRNKDQLSQDYYNLKVCIPNHCAMLSIARKS